jgi:ion channel-forming bestrophin family protein
MAKQTRRGFWRNAFLWRGSITPLVIRIVIAFGLIATAICIASWIAKHYLQLDIALEIEPFKIAGVALGLLLIVRTNTGYDRWWEARKLWGGIVNQTRNLAIGGLTYGPNDIAWRERFIKWVAVFPHAARCSLRGEPPPPEVADLVGTESAKSLAASAHLPSYTAMELADMLREACEKWSMDRFAFIQIDQQRASLIDHIGACERILNTPLPFVFAVKIRQFITLFLLMLPFAFLQKIDTTWLIPFITMMVAYPLIALDQIGIELQNPFSKTNLSHLPLGEISATIQSNVLGLLRDKLAAESRGDFGSFVAQQRPTPG